MINPADGHWVPEGQLKAGPVKPFQAALMDFHKARKKAAMEAIVGRLSGKSMELLSYKDVAKKLHLRGKSDRGVQEIPVEAIVGSFGRYADFSRSFLPRHDWDAERWASVRAASASLGDLPPIDVYKVGDVYFVEDGNHRVSIARLRGIESIAAHVVEVDSRVPLSPDVQPDELILKSEYVAFLERTRLDELRPGVDLSVSLPGQYDKLEGFIELHNYCLETDEMCWISSEDSVTRWYDEEYTPIVEAIREQGILRDFAGRTETDLYIWIAENQRELREELGWDVSPDAVVAKKAAQFTPKAEGPLGQVSQVLNAVSPGSWLDRIRRTSWSQEKMLSRYTDNLFLEIMVPLHLDEDWEALALALLVAAREDAQVDGLLVTDNAEPDESPLIQAMQKTFEQRCQAYGVSGSLAARTGKPLAIMRQWAALIDLIALDRAFLELHRGEKTLGQTLQEIAKQCNRPVLLAANQPCTFERITLIWDHRAEAEEALYAATYLAEKWELDLAVVVLPARRNGGPKAIERVRNYLELHELEATFLSVLTEEAEAILEPCERQHDLLITGGYRGGLLRRSPAANPANHWIEHWTGATLVCS